MWYNYILLKNEGEKILKYCNLSKKYLNAKMHCGTKTFTSENLFNVKAFVCKHFTTFSHDCSVFNNECVVTQSLCMAHIVDYGYNSTVVLLIDFI